MKRMILLAVVLSVGVAAAGWRGRFDEQFAAASTAEWSPAQLGPIAWYKGDGNALDAMGNYNGTWIGTAAYTTGKVGSAFSLGGINSIETAIVATALQGGFSVAAWINPGDGATAINCRIFDKSTGTSANAGLYVVYVGTTQTLEIRVGGRPAFSPTATIPRGTLSHITITIDSSGGCVFYLNGERYQIGTVAAPTNITTSNPLTIGKRSASEDRYFFGIVDDALFFSRALTAEEIEKLYNESINKNGKAW